MKIYDISQEVFSCKVYPGDAAPQKEEVMRMERGDLYNLTEFSMCAHNGTHVDAPYHFLDHGKKIDEIDLSKFIGQAYVAEHEGVVSQKDAVAILEKAKAADEQAAKKILIKGKAEVSIEAAEVFAKEGIRIKDVTPWEERFPNRTAEIKHYLKEHPEIKRYVILDDCFGDNYESDKEIQKHLVFVDALKGLQKENLLAACAVMNMQE